MALFSKKTEKEEIKKSDKKVATTKNTSNRRDDGAVQAVIVHPRITEKSVLLSDGNAYTFVINPRYGKKDVREAVQALYKVTPTKVHITRLPGKSVMRRKGKGFKAGVKKAVVYLKKGDKIEFV